MFPDRQENRADRYLCQSLLSVLGKEPPARSRSRRFGSSRARLSGILVTALARFVNGWPNASQHPAHLL